MKNAILRWWIVVWTSLISAVFIFYNGLFNALWEADHTKISFVIIALYSIVTLFIGHMMKNHYKFKHSDNAKAIFQSALDACWFYSEAMTTLGMIGTVIGFLMMLGPAFAGIDIGDQTKMMAVITNMGSGMSTALTTTLVGLICSLSTKAQLVNLEYGTKSVR